MEQDELGTKKSCNPFASMLDARVKSYAASTHYTPGQKLEVERARLMLEMVYNGTFYTTYRKKFATIKIEKGRVQDYNFLEELEKEYNKRGYVKVATEQGIIYRIPKV